MESQEQSSLMSGIWATKNSQALELRIVNFVSMNFDYQSFVMIWFAPTAKAQLFENEKILICDFSRGVLNTCSARLYPILALRPQIRIISFSGGILPEATQNLSSQSAVYFFKVWWFKVVIFIVDANPASFLSILELKVNITFGQCEFFQSNLFTLWNSKGKFLSVIKP